MQLRDQHSILPLIVGIDGTTNPVSTTELVLRAALRMAEERGARTRLIDGHFLARLPLYAPEVQERTPVQEELVETVRGADGLIVEVHPDPEHALSDGDQSLAPDSFARMMKQLSAFAAAAGRTMGGDRDHAAARRTHREGAVA